MGFEMETLDIILYDHQRIQTLYVFWIKMDKYSIHSTVRGQHGPTKLRNMFFLPFENGAEGGGGN